MLLSNYIYFKRRIHKPHYFSPVKIESSFLNLLLFFDSFAAYDLHASKHHQLLLRD